MSAAANRLKTRIRRHADTVRRGLRVIWPSRPRVPLRGRWASPVDPELTGIELQWYQSMVSASSDLMGFVDSSYTYRAVNQAFCDEQRRTQEEILGHTVAEVLGEEVFETTLKPRLDRCLSGEQVTFDFWRDSPSRGRRHVEARHDPFFEADGSVSGVLVHLRDTTDGKRIEEERERSVTALKAANRELEVVSDALAHDLKSPLLTVTQFSQELNEGLGDSLDEQLEDYLHRVGAAARHMMHIIKDLRDLSQVIRVEISLEEVDLSSLGHEIIDDLRALVPDRELRFEVKAGTTAVGDKRLLRILLTNLLQNAWKYTGPTDDARIELGVDEDENDIPRYHVRDTGIGFDNADRERIFQDFERLHSEREFTGSGLGLGTVERIVHRHGGRVWAESIPGEGAVFHFTLASADRRARPRRASSGRLVTDGGLASAGFGGHA